MRACLWLVMVLTGCTTAGPGPTPAAAPKPSAAASKPTAPVTLSISTRRVGLTHEVTLRATPRIDAPELVLELSTGARIRYGATPAGTERTLVAPVRAPGRGLDVIGVARLAGRGAAVSVRLGPKAAPALTRIVTLPGGERVAEVRP